VPNENENKMEYYIHKSMGFHNDYFGEIGEPLKVSRLKAFVMNLLGYRVTKVPDNTSTTEIKVIAAINNGAHPNSYMVQKIREKG
jgi:hypothetical protein